MLGILTEQVKYYEDKRAELLEHMSQGLPQDKYWFMVGRAAALKEVISDIQDTIEKIQKS